ncbi:MAG: aminotransferase class V-fold PLP-dependent enzyme [Candidatus Colwellbacteria bacterium]|nr:aminotransferase class V-fold PLP-dependent enzyme [Candidatus Colwellbacteria bacterium]
MKLFKKPIFVSISPNAQAGDVFLAIKLVLQPWRWRSGGAPREFAKKLKSYLGIKNVFLFESGRTSLYAILMAIGLKAGDEVLVQAFTCTAAVNPILWVEARPVYVDIDSDFNMSPADLEKKVTPRSKAVIIQHTFGYPGKIDEITRIAKKNKLLIIEDAAHALGAKYKSKKVGAFGDAAIFSFGRYKIMSSVFGGAAVTNNPDIARNLERSVDGWDFPSTFWIFEQLFHPILLSVTKPFYNFFSLGKVAVVIAKKLKLISLSVYSEEKSGGKPPFGPSKMPNALALLGLKQIGKLTRFNEHRTSVANFYKESLFRNSKISIVEFPRSSEPAFLNFPISVQDGDLVRQLIKEGKRRGIYLEVWPAKRVIGPSGTDLKKLGYISGSCPKAEDLSARSLVLPTSPNTTMRDARRVVNLINDFFGK